MCQFKTWLRAKTGANQLNDIMFANIQKSDLDKVDIIAINSKFVERTRTRIYYLRR